MKKAGKKGGKWKNTLVQMLLGALLGFFLVVAAERLVGGIAGFALAFLHWWYPTRFIFSSTRADI